MANVDAPLGFNPIKNPHGDTIKAEEYTVVASEEVAPGTMLYMTAAGTVQAYDIATSTGYNKLVGAAMGYVSATATTRTVLVSDDPAQEYEVQTDDNTVNAVTDLNLNYQGTNIDTVNGTLIQSRGEIDGDSQTTTNNSTTIRPFRALRFAGSAEQDDTATYSRIIVRINSENHLHATGGAI